MYQASINVSKNGLDTLIERIQEVYLSDNRPWIIGFSGGKDSTCVLQLVWEALTRLPEEKRTKRVYSISSDTFVEMPILAKYLNDKIAELNEGAVRMGLPISAATVKPDIDETFWVNMIGRGYPAPYKNFRWCTDRMKIKPTTRFIIDKIGRHGEVIVVLGVRRSESSARASTMQAERVTESGKKVGRKMVGQYLAQHKDLPSALVFSPIEDWSTEDVWDFLRNHKSPWGGDHSKLEELYRSAQKPDDDGEDELAERTFGNSRFGCWTCTVVTRDLSMEAFVEKGETWMKPLLEYRDWLMWTQDPEVKHNIRVHKRRSGQVQTFTGKDGKEHLIWGPFTFDFRKEMLEKLLRTQMEVNKLKEESKLFQNEPIELISDAELLQIRKYWRSEEGDWGDSLPKLYEDVTGCVLDVPRDDWSGMGASELESLSEICQKHDLPQGLMTDLFDMEKSFHGMSRRSQIFSKMDTIFRKDWRSKEDVFKDIGLEASNHDLGVGDVVHAAEKNNN